MLLQMHNVHILLSANMHSLTIFLHLIYEEAHLCIHDVKSNLEFWLWCRLWTFLDLSLFEELESAGYIEEGTIGN